MLITLFMTSTLEVFINFFLTGSERGPDSSLLPLLGQGAVVMAGVDFVRQTYKGESDGT